ncbi:hypothetical protein A3E95_02200 [Candidatus Nomurabacteria bacterium RIFCSPHIGHO2_12_FULL_44_22b]|nr:MAG: hypothetical protein A3E95_02200 [Candidatus Nomurabacteria bacterium RIFCSPHIGHO2_12_FULL_44_22b]
MDTIFAGITGEYFVAGELSRRGYIATVSLRNTAHVDILASNGKKAVNIQVKTKRKKVSDGWAMGNKPLEVKKEWQDVFYVFVDLPIELEEKIGYYVIPKNDLNETVENNFQEHKKTPRRNGMPRTTQMRIFRIKEYPKFQTGKYENNWDSIFKF